MHFKVKETEFHKYTHWVKIRCTPELAVQWTKEEIVKIVDLQNVERPLEAFSTRPNMNEKQFEPNMKSAL